MKTLGLILLWIALVPLIALTGVWCTLAIRFSNLPGETLRYVAAGAFAGGFLLAFLLLRNRLRTAVAFFGVSVAVLIWWLFIPASNDRDWDPNWGRLPSAKIEGDRVTIRNIRNFDYRTTDDFTVRYHDRTYDLAKLETIDFVKSHWDGIRDVAHTMLSFGFHNAKDSWDFVTVSVETRREKGEPQTAIRGLFKQYELIYILGDERDLLRLRTNFRKEDVYVYPTTSPPGDVRIVFLDILKRINEIHAHAAWYNTISHNCTTSLVPHLEKIRRRRVGCLDLLINGDTDRMALKNGWIRSDLSFEETRALHYANQYVRDAQDPPDYSLLIRPQLRGITRPLDPNEGRIGEAPGLNEPSGR